MLPPPHVRAWYWYAFAAEVFSACALVRRSSLYDSEDSCSSFPQAIFLPITLEQMAREVGYYAPDMNKPCLIDENGGGSVGRVCKAKVLGVWIDTASFSMYVKSIAVACQAICIISIGPLADSTYWRKRLLLMFAYVGSLSGVAFLLFPTTLRTWVAIVAAFLFIVGNVTYAASIVCNNAFLPQLAREDGDVRRAQEQAVCEEPVTEGISAEDIREDDNSDSSLSIEDEGTRLLSNRFISTVRALSTQDLAQSDPIKVEPEPVSLTEHYESLLSLTMSRLSSTGTAIGFFSGVSVLALLLIPVITLNGNTFSLRLAISLSGFWWAVFTVPAWLGLPGGTTDQSSHFKAMQVKEAWIRIGRMVTVDQIKQLPDLYLFLLAWVFLSDGFHTTTYTAILYASSVLSMPASKITLIGILVQLAAVVSSTAVPQVQRKLSKGSNKPLTNHKILVIGVLAAVVIPLYTCLGLILPFGGLRTEGEMYVLAVWFGLVFGPFLSYSRALYAELIPPRHESTFFALFSFTDKSASFIGPAAVGLISDLTGNIRYGFVFLLIMLVAPILILTKVNVDRGKKAAKTWSEQVVNKGVQQNGALLD
nr:UMF1 family MFS transporter [Cryptococcus depauperatus CBS 7841]